jgi:hypothetical protein
VGAEVVKVIVAAIPFKPINPGPEPDIVKARLVPAPEINTESFPPPMAENIIELVLTVTFSG